MCKDGKNYKCKFCTGGVKGEVKFGSKWLCDGDRTAQSVGHTFIKNKVLGTTPRLIIYKTNMCESVTSKSIAI